MKFFKDHKEALWWIKQTPEGMGFGTMSLRCNLQVSTLRSMWVSYCENNWSRVRTAFYKGKYPKEINSKLIIPRKNLYK